MNSKLTKIALVDDHTLVNEALAKIINDSHGYVVMLQAANGKDLIEQLRKDNLPDLVILDIHMPVMNGYDTAKWLNEHYPKIIVLVLTMVITDVSTLLLIQSGVHGMVKKNIHTADLLRAINETIETRCNFPNKRLAALLQSGPSGGMLANSMQLSEREILFLKLVCGNLTYKEIAFEMGVQPRTVDTYRENLFRKLSLTSKTDLVRFALKNGLVSVEALDNS